MNINDADAREQALDITKSFIVQAPAGSGKTELLIQRYLALLAKVEKKPEQIIAITFTRKAAIEMRYRVINWLVLAKNTNKPRDLHSLKSWSLARMVLARDNQEGWELLTNHNRLSIQTIDSLAASFVSRMPIASRFGTNLNISENINDLYLQAASDLLQEVGEDIPWSTNINNLLMALDNNFSRAQILLANLLSVRDQWLSFGLVGKYGDEVKEVLKNSLQAVVQYELDLLRNVFLEYDQDLLFKTIKFSIKNIQEKNEESAILNCAGYDKLPGNHGENLGFWQGVIELFFTKAGAVRKKVTAKQGFPAGSIIKDTAIKQKCLEHKKIAGDFLEDLQQNVILSSLLPQSLWVANMSCDKFYWDMLNNILVLLPVVVAHLHLVFKSSGSVDFIEVMQGADRALGESNSPSDLALMLDHKIQHILLDEFQDTSWVQWRFLEKLISGWQADGQQTLFLVGDPMQSIYSFRQADVSLFLRAQAYGIGDIKLESLTLKTNFRSMSNLVNWCNETMMGIFPKKNNLNKGAVAFSDSIAIKSQDNTGVQLFCNLPDDEVSEVVNVVKNSLINEPNDTIGILVRSRTHLLDLCSQLENANISYDSIEIEPLSNKLHIKDLLSLTKIIINPHDSLAWLSVLRAPWCGLLLRDLHLLAENKEQTIWGNLQDSIDNNYLSADGRLRVIYFVDRFSLIMDYLHRAPVVQLVKLAWENLSGNDFLATAQDKEHVKTFFDYLEQLEDADDLYDSAKLQEKFQGLLATNQAAGKTNVSVMTIHKAKGLEFDAVILLGLHRRAPYDQKQLINWCNLSYTDNYYLLVSALENINNPSAVLKFIQAINKERKHYELARLLYVAITRAKKHLFLFAAVANPDASKPTNISGSFYGLLGSRFNSSISSRIENKSLPEQKKILLYRRKNIPTTREIKSIEKVPSNNSHEAQDYLWQPDVFKIIGIVFHQIIHVYTYNKSMRQQWRDHEKYWLNCLKSAGVLFQYLEQALKIIKQCIFNMMMTKRGQWLFANYQQEAGELELYKLSQDKVKTFRIDRIFIDSHRCWIIDYKVVSVDKLMEEKEQSFLMEQQQKYEFQMAQYGELMSLKTQHLIKLALYFPYNNLWIEWDYAKEDQLSAKELLSYNNELV